MTGPAAGPLQLPLAVAGGYSPRISVIETDLRRFRKWLSAPTPSGCIIWTGTRDQSGYGGFSLGGRKVGAHRASYEHVYGTIPPGLQLDHLCRQRPCVNPAHMEVVTPLENWLRGNAPSAIAARRETCAKGHPHTTENTRYESNRRACRTCDRERQTRYKARGRSA